MQIDQVPRVCVKTTPARKGQVCTLDAAHGLASLARWDGIPSASTRTVPGDGLSASDVCIAASSPTSRSFVSQDVRCYPGCPRPTSLV